MNLFHIKANILYKMNNFIESSYIYTFLIENGYKCDIMYSNRCACYLQLKQYTKALNDALKSVEININYTKSWGRIGFAYKGLKMFSESNKAFEIAYNQDKTNKIYLYEIQFFFNKNINIKNVFNIILNDKNIYNNLKKLKYELINNNSETLLENKQVNGLIYNIIDKMKL